VVLLAHSFFLRRDAKQLERLKPYPPLTTLLAAAMLREARHPVDLFDATFQEDASAFAGMLDRLNPSVLLLIEDNFNFLTKMCTESRREDALAMIAAARLRGWRVAVNSPDAIDHPQLYLDAGACAVLTGEGEFSANAVVQALQQGDSLVQVPGLILENLQRTPAQLSRADLDALPLPAWDLIDADAYREAWVGAHGYFSWNVAASRGCPYSCNWCAKPTFGRRYSQRSAASVAEEMRRLKDEVAPDHIWFADDIFGMTAEWIGEFAHEIRRQEAIIPHRCIADATGNPAFLQAFDALWADVEKVMRAGVDISRSRPPEVIAVMLNEHEVIVDSIRMRDPERAGMAMRWHLLEGRRRLMP
jgi:anaerobic magnesium-protoporphyrin IX monomethyl ester cyclase